MSLETGTNNWRASVEIPDDGDERDAAGTNVALEALLDRTTYLYEHTQNGNGSSALGNTTVVTLSYASAATIVRQVPLKPLLNASGNWILEQAVTGSPAVPLWFRYSTSTAASPGDWILLPLTDLIPATSVITGFRVKNSAPSAASRPATASDRMAAQLFTQNMAELTDSQLSTAGSIFYDQSADNTAYRAIHYIAATGLSVAVAFGYDYYLGFRADLNGYGELYQAEVTFTAAIVRPGGA